MSETHGAAPEPTSQPDALRLLLEVQAQDIVLDQIAYRRRELPERAALASVEQQMKALSVRISALSEQRDVLSARQAEIEEQVTGFDRRIAAIEERIRQGGDYRDVQHMSDEVGSLSRHRSELEDAELEVMEQLEPIETELGELHTELATCDGMRTEAAASLAAAELATDEEAAAVKQRRHDLAAGLPGPLANSYERLRERLGGVGAARLSDGMCSGCHLKLPSSERDRILHAAPDEIHYCDQCGRILVA
jgi:predicted  nucleic acid-binding Zn-ribbon protein